MYTLEINGEETTHETLEEVAAEVFEHVEFDREEPFDSVRGEYRVKGMSLEYYTFIENLVTELIGEIKQQAAEWNEHIKMEKM